MSIATILKCPCLHICLLSGVEEQITFVCIWDVKQISCTSFQEGGSLVVSGPLWTGPLHSASYLTEMSNMAEQLGWMGNGVGTDLQKLLQLMVDESDPKLPFGYIKLDEVSFIVFFTYHFLFLWSLVDV